MNNKFRQDLKVGHSAEDKVKEFFEKKGYKVDYNNSTNYQTLKEYDLLINNKTKIEVKNDVLAQKTGNIAIEFECNSKPSGITSSKAQIWALIVGHELLLFSLKSLKFIFQNKLYNRIVNGGDNHKARLMLIKKDEILKYGILKNI